MDKALKRTVINAALAAAALAAAPVWCQGLTDPTRPPPVFMTAIPGAAAVVTPARPTLQSVLIGRQQDGRKLAVIDGETVRLGGRFRGAVLVRITETEVELMRGSERQVLKLFAAANPKADPAAQR